MLTISNVAIKDNVWTDQEYDLATIADNQPTVYVRWSYAILKGGAYACSGWNIDDICVTGLECRAPVLVGNLKCDGFIDFGDINPFVVRLSDPAAYAAAFPDCPDDNRDINGSGSVRFDDINPLVALLGARRRTRSPAIAGGLTQGPLAAGKNVDTARGSGSGPAAQCAAKSASHVDAPKHSPAFRHRRGRFVVAAAGSRCLQCTWRCGSGQSATCRGRTAVGCAQVLHDNALPSDHPSGGTNCDHAT